MTNMLVVFITAPSKEVGQVIARSLVEQQLAACVNITAPIESIYTWNGAVQQEEEVLLICKTRSDLFAGPFIPAVKAVHPYDTPEIIALPITAGAEDYLAWMRAVTKSEN